MSQTIFNLSEPSTPLAFEEVEISLASSPTSISWFIDRTGDPTILEDLTPIRLSWPESDEIVLEELGLIQPPHASINNDRYFSDNSLSNAAAASSRYILNSNNFINNFRNNNFRNNHFRNNHFRSIAIDPTIINTIVQVDVDENIEVTPEQEDCCICMEENEKTDICLLSCTHSFCVDCIKKHFETPSRRHENLSCPLCRANVISIRVQSIENRNKFLMR